MKSQTRSKWKLHLCGRITCRHCRQPKLPNFLYSSNTTSWRLMRRVNNNNKLQTSSNVIPACPEQVAAASLSAENERHQQHVTDATQSHLRQPTVLTPRNHSPVRDVDSELQHFGAETLLVIAQRALEEVGAGRAGVFLDKCRATHGHTIDGRKDIIQHQCVTEMMEHMPESAVSQPELLKATFTSTIQTSIGVSQLVEMCVPVLRM